MRLVLTFELADAHYGLDIAEVQEIVEAPHRYFIPNAPECYNGVINFHGTIVPVVDLASLLGLDTDGLDHRVIVLRSGRYALGFAVTRLGRIIRPQNAESLPCETDRQRHPCISERLHHEADVINLLDVSLLLTRLETLPGQFQEMADGL